MFPAPRLLARPGAVPPVGEPIWQDPAEATPTPSVGDALARPAEAAAALAVLDPTPSALAAVNALHAGSMSDAGLIDALVASEKLLATVSAKQCEFLAEIARRDPDGQDFLRDEAACALKIAPATAAQKLDDAGLLPDAGGVPGRGPTRGAAIVMSAINAWAGRDGKDDTRTADQRRADTIVDICSHALAMPDVPHQHGIRPTINLTVAESSLRGEDDQPADLDGYGPIPASMARRLADLPGAKQHRFLVDTTGRILDPDGALTSAQYTPPAPIARHVIARDRHCIHPGCRRNAWNCELDHRIPWPDGQPRRRTSNRFANDTTT